MPGEVHAEDPKLSLRVFGMGNSHIIAQPTERADFLPQFHADALGNPAIPIDNGYSFTLSFRIVRLVCRNSRKFLIQIVCRLDGYSNANDKENMTSTYLGYLSHDDPLYGYFQSQIAPQLGITSGDGSYRVSRFNESHDVYLYAEEHMGTQWVGKFFKTADPEWSRKKGENEYNNLLYLRGLGFSSQPHYVVKPLGFNPGIDNVLIVEYVTGEPLSKIIIDAMYFGNRNRLYKKLSALAHFLATLHNRTAGDYAVNFDENYQYMGRLVQSLVEKQGLGREYAEAFWSLRDIWRSRRCMWEDRNVIVHGDTTPANFLFGRRNHVMAIDLERMKWSDRVFDLGRLCGELKHFFFRGTQDPFSAEPFIGHFLWEYCRYFPDHENTFRSITQRIPFYMGITLLRISRNAWIDGEYRTRLIHEARQILSASI